MWITAWVSVWNSIMRSIWSYGQFREIDNSWSRSRCLENPPGNFSGQRIHDILPLSQYNKLSHSCSSYSVFGVMADEDMVVLNSTRGYGKQTSADEDSTGTRVAHFTWDDIEQQTGLTINTLIIDCEGCLFDIIATYKHKFKQIQKIIIENDENSGEDTFSGHIFSTLFYPSCGERCQAANTFLQSEGFQLVRQVHSLHYHFIFTRE